MATPNRSDGRIRSLEEQLAYHEKEIEQLGQILREKKNPEAGFCPFCRSDWGPRAEEPVIIVEANCEQVTGVSWETALAIAHALGVPAYRAESDLSLQVIPAKLLVAAIATHGAEVSEAELLASRYAQLTARNKAANAAAKEAAIAAKKNRPSKAKNGSGGRRRLILK